MYSAVALASLSLLTAVRGQQVGTNTAETHPSLSWQKCVTGGTCTTQSASVVLDSNWRWLHTTTGTTNCYDGNTWNTTLCPNPTTCAANCALDGADYSGTYGITTSGSALTLKFVTNGPYSVNIGSRVYLMAAGSQTAYEMFKPKNQEFTFDVDVSNLPCGLNGALYFVQMDADGGMSKYTGNKAGAKYGTGYCDAQCPHDIKFINGEANTIGWTASSNDVNAGTGQYGSCCDEMDIWEANSMATAYTPHPCSSNGQTRCSGTQCGDGSNRYGGICDKDGCDFNSYRMGNTTFWGKGKTVDSTKVMTVVTQFITSTGTASGALSEIRRFYVQGGKVFANSNINIAGITAANSLTDTICKQSKVAFGDTDDFSAKGGMAAMGDALSAGVVLVMSIWDDHAANMLWLDSTYPTTSTALGAKRGECATTSGVPADVEAQSPNSSVVFSNIKFGDIGSTFNSAGTGTGTGSSTTIGTSTTSVRTSSTSTVRTTSSTRTTSTSTVRTTSTTATGGSGAAHWAQCGGIGWTGPTSCVSPFTCTSLNPYYSQCL